MSIACRKKFVVADDQQRCFYAILQLDWNEAQQSLAHLNTNETRQVRLLQRIVAGESSSAHAPTADHGHSGAHSGLGLDVSSAARKRLGICEIIHRASAHALLDKDISALTEILRDPTVALALANGYAFDWSGVTAEPWCQRCETLQSPDDEFTTCAAIFCGWHHVSLGDNVRASAHFCAAALTSMIKGWPYLLLRAAYGMAQIAESDVLPFARRLLANSRLGGHLSGLLLESIVYPSVDPKMNLTTFGRSLAYDHPNMENRGAARLVFDPNEYRVQIGPKWLSLHARPLIYAFLEAVNQADAFVSKEKLANRLWPNESYRPRMHDPRIFDIAKRTRRIVEASSDSGMTLLSSRLGYKFGRRVDF